MRLISRIFWQLDRWERDGGMRDFEAALPWLALLICAYAALWRMVGQEPLWRMLL